MLERKLSYSIPEVRQSTGLGKTTVYKAIAEKRLRARKFGNRTLILSTDLNDFLNSLPEINVDNVGTVSNIAGKVGHEH